MNDEHSRGAPARSPWRDPWIWAVFLVALALRLVYLIDLRHTPFFADPQMDPAYHHRLALEIAQGAWWGDQVFFRAPLYPYFLGVLYALAGPDFLLARGVQFVIGAGTAALTAVLCYRRFGRAAAVLAGFLVAFHGPLIYFEGELLLVVLEAPLNLLAAWALDRAVSGGGPRRWILAGAVVGVGALARPIILAVVPVVLLYLLWRRGRAALRPWLIYAGTVALVLTPVLVRNYIVGRDVVPVASQGGLNYYLGNNEYADGMAARSPELRGDWQGGLDDAERWAEVSLGGEAKPSQVSDYWYRRAFEWAREDPGAFLRLQLKKAVLFWDAFEIPNNQDYYYFSRLARLFQVPVLSAFGLLGPLALAGLVLGLVRRRMPFAWTMVPLTLMVVIIAFFVCGKFRASLVPLFAVWAGVGLSLALSLLWNQKRRPFLLYSAVLLAAAWAVNGDLSTLRYWHTPAESHLRLGVFYAKNGDSGRAMAHYKSAVRVLPHFPEGWNNMGALHAQLGRFGDARHAFTTALAVQPNHPRALGNLASLALQEGKHAEADSLARLTLRSAGRSPEALYNAAAVLGNLGQHDLAQQAFHVIVFQQPMNSAARLGEAKALVMLGRSEDARALILATPPAARTVELGTLLKQIEGP